MTVLCDYQTCGYCQRHLEDPVGTGIKIILSSICLWNGESVNRSGTYYICKDCYASKHWGKGELITGIYLQREQRRLPAKKEPENSKVQSAANVSRRMIPKAPKKHKITRV
jgi:hypothetical protein